VTRFRILLAFILMFASGMTLAHAQGKAQNKYPSRPITLIVPFAPGGSSDIFARDFAHRLEARLGQQIVIENRGGASGAIGTAAAAKAEPDGYTLLLGHTTALAVLPLVRNDLSYAPVKDFAPVTLIAATPQVLVVHPGVANSIGEFLTRARAEPGKLTYASGGANTPPHLAAELFKQQAGIDILHVPFNGSAGGTSALLGGHVHASFQNIDSILPQIQSGALKALAIAAEKRSEFLPDVPTFDEAGVRGVVNKTWFSIVAPANVPQDVLAVLQKEARAVAESEDFRQFVKKQVADPLPAGPDAFRVFLNEEIDRWTRVLRSAAAQVN
jgi:tripartite-type tricarboxylate transporter receptor subunit TctC